MTTSIQYGLYFLEAISGRRHFYAKRESAEVTRLRYIRRYNLDRPWNTTVGDNF